MPADAAPRPGAGAAQLYGTGGSAGAGSGSATNLGDILERVLDKGLVIAGDIQVNLLDIELLTIKLRLVIASLDTARQVGINWWENDPWLSADAGRPVSGKPVSRKPVSGKPVSGELVRGEGDSGRETRGGNRARELREENRRLRNRIRELESGQ